MPVDIKQYCGLIKIGVFEHMSALYEEGELYFNTFKYFRELECSSDGRGDPNEYLSYYGGNGTKVAIKRKGDKEYTQINDVQFVSMRNNQEEYSHLYCLSSINKSWTYKNKLSDCSNISTELLNFRKKRYIEKCVEAMNSQASIQEIYVVTNLLRNHINDKDKAYELTGLSEIKDRLLYSSSKLLGGCRSQNGGFDFAHEEIFRKIITHTKVWDLYNLLTYISSHEINKYKILSERKLSRDASAFLSRRRDFVDYIDLDDVA